VSTVQWLAEMVQRFLTERRPGRALAMLARAPIPILVPDRFAARAPELALDSTSPLVDTCDPTAVAGVLDGDVVIKDQIDVAGTRTGVGLLDGGTRAERDAAIVARIAAAGGRIIGKAKMTELGIDGIGTLMHYPMPRNAVAPAYVPGGSSTGTAVAVASGLARYGIGGDGLGSIRIPAAFNGLVGLKPTRTRYPHEGIRSPVRTMDAVGPITRTVADCIALWQVMAGEPAAALEPLVPEVVGVPIGGNLRVTRTIWRAFRRVLEALGTRSVRVAIKGFDNATFLGGMTGAYELATGPYADRVATASGRMSRALGGAFSPRDVDRLAAHRAELCAATDRVLASTPILAMPTTAIPPPALSRALVAGEQEIMLLRALGAFTPLANLCDLPSIAVPCGVDEVGRPLSVMFVTTRNHETDLLRVALAVERTGIGRMLCA
jgi:Asp-tRNA(Asn)/Glu-tRNA(Gln) amidotransferase A subunit family amidase